MDITIIYKNGETIGAYRSFNKARRELVAEVQRACPERTSAGILAELDEEGSIDNYWYYDVIEVDMEGDD